MVKQLSLWGPFSQVLHLHAMEAKMFENKLIKENQTQTRGKNTKVICGTDLMEYKDRSDAA